LEDLVRDKSKGELRVFGKRWAAIDVQSLCDHLNTLAGPVVAEVIMKQHEFRLGRDDVARIRQENPSMTTQDVINWIVEMERATGIGVDTVMLPQGSDSAVRLEISNPIVKGEKGAERSLMLAYWAGVFSTLFEKNYEYTDVAYDADGNVLTCRFVPRETK